MKSEVTEVTSLFVKLYFFVQFRTLEDSHHFFREVVEKLQVYSKESRLRKENADAQKFVVL